MSIPDDLNLDRLRPKWSEFIPHGPTPKQLAFLIVSQTVSETLFGGAAGGGKSDALLMGALQYVDVPGYSAIVFRKTLTDLKQPGALLDRAHAWLSPFCYKGGPVKWVAGEHCLTPDTEVLTEHGWRRITDVPVATNVASLSPDRKIQFHPVKQITEADFDGKMLDVDGKVSFTCTPNHRVLRSPSTNNASGFTGKLTYTKAEDLPNLVRIPQTGTWDGEAIPKSITWDSKRTSSKPVTFEIGDWMEFLGWFISEGWTVPNLGRVSVAQEKPEGREAIQELLERVDGNYFETSKDFNIVNKALCDYLRDNCGETAQTKCIPREWLRLPPRLLERLLFSLISGDGSWKCPTTSAAFYSSSKQLADDVCEVAFLCGWIPSITEKKPSKTQYGKSKIWTVNLRKARCDTSIKLDTHSEWIDYSGKVYCLTVEPHSNFLIRHRGKVCWTGNTYYFATQYPDGTPGEPSKLVFGYIGNENVRTRYQSAEFQCVEFDELTQHFEADYTYMFSRRRKNACPIHKRGADGSPNYVKGCMYCDLQKSIPLRTMAATNPGGIGHQWVKERYSIEPHMDPDEAAAKGIHVKWLGRNPKRPFIPAFLSDNPYIDQTSYDEGLEELGPEAKQQLKYGDWGASADARFKRADAKFYSVRGHYFVLGRDGRGPMHSRNQFRRLFATVDPAGSQQEGPGDEFRYGNRQPSWTVISIWGLTRDWNLIWLDMWRKRCEIPDIMHGFKAMHSRWNPQYWTIEQNGLGLGVCQAAVRAGYTVKRQHRTRDKIINSTAAQIRMANGQIWFPQNAPWKQACTGEVFTWSGHPYETDDIVDTLSDAVNDIAWMAAGNERSDAKMMHGINKNDIPGVMFEGRGDPYRDGGQAFPTPSSSLPGFYPG